jgi:hypothetical protein
MIDGAALIWREWRQGWQRIGFGGGELRATERAKGVPALGEEEFGFGAAVVARRDIGGQRDGFGARGLTKQAAPFSEQTVDVATAGEFLRIDDVAGRFVRGDNRGDDFAGAETVAGRQAFVEIALDGGAAISAFADRGKAAEAAGIRAGEAIGGEEVGAVEEQRIERVTAVFERGGEGKAFGAEVTRDDGAR